MKFRDGTLDQKLVFAFVLTIYVLGLTVALTDKLERVGESDVGWVMDGYYASPVRRDAAEAGLRGGGAAVRINGIELLGKSLRKDIEPNIRTEVGSANTITVRHPGGAVTDVVIPVRPLQWRDVLYAEGTTLALGFLFFATGLTSFVLRPYTPGGWAILVMCTVAGGLLTNLHLRIGPHDVVKAFYFRSMVGILPLVPLHAALVFPVIHPSFLRYGWILPLIYALALGHATLQCVAWYSDYAGFLRSIGALDNTLFLATLLVFVGRCLVLALRARDPLIRQRARILLFGAVFGGAPFALLNFLRNAFGVLIVDMQTAFWTVSPFLLSIGYLTLRHDLLNARVAVRRAVIYAGVVALLTVVALFLITFRPYAVAVLLLPLLYWWPRFDARLNAWLYPQRARFPELIRDIGDEMASQTTIGGVLGVLAHAPIAMCGGRGATAFLFGSHSNAREDVSSAGDLSLTSGRPLAVERIVQLMVATKKEILRDHIAVEPQFSNIRDECYRGFERLGAVAVIPILRGNEVIGGLAVAPRQTGDPFDSVDLQALATLAQQASQAIGRIEATETLRAREREFADLKRFFPPQIIDQVMARGGAAELRSQRKLVTVFFADLRGFTSFSDSVEPEEVMATLAEYHAAMGQRIAEFAGTLERFAGDGFMVFFNDPVDQPDHADRAVSMALAMRWDIETLREGWAKKGYEIDVGMGIHSGYATCGFIGYEGRRDYGVIGNVTNLAARLSDAAKGGEVLVTARVLAELRNQYHTEPLGDLTLKGFHQPQSVYRVLPVGETAWQK